jgi:chromosome segregation ATPase
MELELSCENGKEKIEAMALSITEYELCVRSAREEKVHFLQLLKAEQSETSKLRQRIQTTENQLDTAAEEIQHLFDRNTENELRIQDMIQLSAASDRDQKETTRRLENESSSLREALASKDEEVAKKDSSLKRLGDARDTLLSQNKVLSCDLDRRSEKLRALEDQLSQAMSNKDVLSACLKESQENVGILTAEIKEIHERVTLTVRESETKDSVLSSQNQKISKLEADLVSSERLVLSLRQECLDAKDEILLLRDMTSSQTTALKTRNDELETVCQNIRVKLRNAEESGRITKEELDRVLSSQQSLFKSLSECVEERDEATAEVEKLHQKNCELKDSIASAFPKEEEEKLRAELRSLRIQDLEGRQLLASVNESNERLRDKVTQLENDLNLQCAHLEEVTSKLSQRNEEISQFINNRPCNTLFVESRAELIERVETLLQENAAHEKRLQAEKTSRQAHEEELRKQMGEEQRALLQEGETVMVSLREDLLKCEAKLSQAESEAYTARQQAEEMSDERKRLEQKYNDMEKKMMSYDGVIAMETSRISELQNELSKAKSECYSLKESAIATRDKFRRCTRDSEKAMKKSSLLAQDVEALRQKVSSLEMQIERSQSDNARLRQKCHEIGKKNLEATSSSEEVNSKNVEVAKLEKLVAALERDKVRLSSENKKLQAFQNSTASHDENVSKVEKLNEEIKQKDLRIKKLEAVRITKDQMFKIKNIKVSAMLPLYYDRRCFLVHSAHNTRLYR